MKQIIKYYYNIDVDMINEINNVYSFLLDNNKYFFVPLLRDEKELDDIIASSREVKAKNIKCHDIIINKFKKIVSMYGEKKYVLLKVDNNYQKEYSIFEMIELNKKLPLTSTRKNQYKNNWEQLWSQKIDYFEYQIRNYGKRKEGVLNTFSYYLGLAENAVVYVAKTNKDIAFDSTLDRVTLNHRRVFYPNYQLNYLNPLAFVFDLEVRDYAEYFKAAFFANEDIYYEFSAFLKSFKCGGYSYQMLYARLLFPSYYFDLYESIIRDEKDDDELINIIKKSNEYEKFLQYAFLEISKYYPIKKIDWIINKKIL